MNTPKWRRSIVAITLIILAFPADSRAQQALPTIEIGTRKPLRSAKPEKPRAPAQSAGAESTVAAPYGAADKFGNLPRGAYVTPDASTAMKMEVPIRDIPQSVKVITPQMIQDQGPQLRTIDLAKQVSGVIADPIGTGSGIYNAPHYQIRGFSNGGRILLDGMERDDNGSSVDFFDIDHVEFLKGPSSTLYGGSAASYGGIVNFITKKPTDKFFAQLTEGIGSFAFHRTTIDVNTPLRDDKSLLFRLNAAFEEKGAVVHNEYHDAIWVAPALTWIIDDNDILTFHGQYGVHHDRGGFGVPVWPVFQFLPRERYIGDIRLNGNNTVANTTFRYVHKFDEKWSITATADYNRSGIFVPFGGPSFDGLSTYDFGSIGAVYGNVSDTLNGQVDLKGKLDTGPFKHTLLMGIYRTNFWNRNNQTVKFPTSPEFINIFYPIYPSGACFYPVQGCAADAIPLSGNVQRSVSAFYAQDLIEITDQFKLLLGGRYDYGRQWSAIRDAAGIAGGDSFTTTKFDYFSPHVGGVFQPLKDTSIFAGWGRSFNPSNGFLSPGIVAPPEYSEQIDMGVKQELLDGRVQAGVTAFDITRKNILVADPNDLTGLRNILVGEYRSHGLEFDLGGNVLPNLRVNGAATFMHGVAGRDTSTPTNEGSELPYAPRRFYSLSAIYSFKEGDLAGLDVGANFYYRGKTPALFPNAPQANLFALQNGGLFGPNQYPFKIAPIYDFGLFASYQVSERIKVQVNANNLFDRANWASNGQTMIRGVPRSIFANITYRFD